MLDLKHTHRGIKLNIRSIFRLFVNKGTLVGALNIRLIHSYIIFVSNKIIYRYFISRKYITIIPLLYFYKKRTERNFESNGGKNTNYTFDIFSILQKNQNVNPERENNKSISIEKLCKHPFPATTAPLQQPLIQSLLFHPRKSSNNKISKLVFTLPNSRS